MTQGSQPQLNPDLRTYSTVEHWMTAVNERFHLSDEEWAGRLQTLRQFCESEGKDPDTVIYDARSDRAEKIDYMRRLKRFVKSTSLGPTASHDAENVVRSFFINNGARVVTKPYADVYERTYGEESGG